MAWVAGSLIIFSGFSQAVPCRQDIVWEHILTKTPDFVGTLEAPFKKVRSGYTLRENPNSASLNLHVCNFNNWMIG